MSVFNKVKQMTQEKIEKQVEKITESINEKTTPKICDICGKSTILVSNFDDVVLCKSCMIKLKMYSKKQEYETNDDVLKEKEKIKDKAVKMGASDKVLMLLEKRYNSRIIEGLVYNIEGERQRIKIFENYFQIITYEIDDELKKKYYKVMNESDSGIASELLSNIDMSSIALGLIAPGGIATKGVKIVKSATLATGAKTIMNSVNSKINSFPMYKGERTIRYDEYDSIKIKVSDKVGLGVLIFHNTKNSNIEDAVFMFSNYEDKVNKVNKICDYIKSRVMDIIKANSANNQSQQQFIKQENINLSVADEILKFKKLLDMGAITEEEYNKKKAELLNL